ncbi:DNA-binding domain-containing protein [Duganella sp.]|uniref:DNA-binding domain-containing protein n=1 Tax=Duganella sp. TaxID=1904440 RepID=UPI0031DFD526
MKLATLQRDFSTWLVAPTAPLAARLGPEVRLAVYQNNYRSQLIGCLEHCYPLLRGWMGEHAFLGVAVRHIDAHPPHGWTLDAYADGFHATLAAAYPDHPDLHELAWIEHALNTAFVAADAAPVTQQGLAALDWECALLQLTPSLQLREAATNAEAIWSALWEQRPVPEGAMLDQPGGYLVWRRAHTVLLRQADALEYAALLQLQRDRSFAALCDWLVAQCGEQDGIARAGALLAQWLAAELITGIDVV